MVNKVDEIIKQNCVAENKGVFYINYPTEEEIAVEKSYLEARIKEKRIYGDVIVNSLPTVSKKHRHYSEWIVRKRSAAKLFSYLSGNRKPNTVLELGCGNGWLSAMLTGLNDTFVFGMDINHMELEQGARAFKKENLMFVYGDIFNEAVSALRFDYAIVASSASYFQDLDKLIKRLLSLLNENGEIHFVDNPSFSPDEIETARERSKNYYELIDVLEMSSHYFHHDLKDIVKKYDHKVLYDPRNVFNKIMRKIDKSMSPFYWVKIVKS
jgi:SAM-dependent methyltransferase